MKHQGDPTTAKISSLALPTPRVLCFGWAARRSKRYSNKVMPRERTNPAPCRSDTKHRKRFLASLYNQSAAFVCEPSARLLANARTSSQMPSESGVSLQQSTVFAPDALANILQMARRALASVLSSRAHHRLAVRLRSGLPRARDTHDLSRNTRTFSQVQAAPGPR
ncbi:hypothetical protein CBOM_07694 [Ceraceosorus bombacis]|uniref:Uncharacterized protein n=1 Tax=Ceraceosorus bombacis TaxID=401625 RepID=A0A0P1B9Y8_9BASI|nr:hypothetical protein CBOM_07694 [Ceraceosorus bombacis]